uniref:Uncharacterized protein n=1 Tax=Meloidogyne enterolobii TaxID=390850 RepID=A0A6V7Y068_MELEN|nr:unnamed protein product [Meloidogyne enterolobii]
MIHFLLPNLIYLTYQLNCLLYYFYLLLKLINIKLINTFNNLLHQFVPFYPYF